jgi:ribosomal protein S18 acetylase RimI-like enzyme
MRKKTSRAKVNAQSGRGASRATTRPRQAVRVELEPLSAGAFEDFRRTSERGYAAIQVAAGLWPREGARARAAAALRLLLPKDLATPGHHVFAIRDPLRSACVGHLWVAEMQAAGVRTVYIYDIHIRGRFRGLGLGGAAIRALRTWARRRRAAVIELRVHARNIRARELYERTGFVVTDMRMALRLDP